jgi:hypothetical protein
MSFPLSASLTSPAQLNAQCSRTEQPATARFRGASRPDSLELTTAQPAVQQPISKGQKFKAISLGAGAALASAFIALPLAIVTGLLGIAFPPLHLAAGMLACAPLAIGAGIALLSLKKDKK